jgi:hypothetical protein
MCLEFAKELPMAAKLYEKITMVSYHYWISNGFTTMHKKPLYLYKNGKYLFLVNSHCKTLLR